MTAPDRPVVMKKIQRYRLDFQTLEAHNSTRILPQSDGQLVFYGDHVAALAACASQSKSRLARYDEAVRLPHKALAEFNDAEIAVFLAAEPKTEERFPLEEVAPEEAQRRYLKLMKTEERNG